MKSTQRTGRVVATYGRLYEVQEQRPGALLADAPARFQCVRRGKRHDVACGDEVTFDGDSAGQGVIEAILPRRNLLYRADGQREKMLASNLDLVLVVLAPEPTPSEALLSHALVAAQSAGIEAWIILNKNDLAQVGVLSQTLNYYRLLGYSVLEISALKNPDALRALIAQRVSLLVGQSGMGKSTLVNALVPQARAPTKTISQALDSGRHTTTFTRYYPLDLDQPERGGGLIDSPGLQAFGLSYLRPEQIVGAFPEFERLLGQCRFANCRHLTEPECAFRTWAQGDPQRLARLGYLVHLQAASTAKRYV